MCQLQLLNSIASLVWLSASEFAQSFEATKKITLFGQDEGWGRMCPNDNQFPFYNFQTTVGVCNSLNYRPPRSAHLDLFHYPLSNGSVDWFIRGNHNQFIRRGETRWLLYLRYHLPSTRWGILTNSRGSSLGSFLLGIYFRRWSINSLLGYDLWDSSDPSS